jgi:hypothetical protein
LFNHDESRDIWIVHNSHVEGEAPIRAGEGADNGETCMSVEQGVAHNYGRPAALLLMSRLRVERDGNEVTFLGNIARHLPVLSPNWLSPFNFFGLVILRDAGHQLLQAQSASYAPYGSNDNHAVSCGHINRITNRNASLLKNMLSKAEPLAVAPFLNFGYHIHISLVYTKYSHNPISCQAHLRPNLFFELIAQNIGNLSIPRIIPLKLSGVVPEARSAEGTICITCAGSPQC